MIDIKFLHDTTSPTLILVHEVGLDEWLMTVRWGSDGHCLASSHSLLSRGGTQNNFLTETLLCAPKTCKTDR